MEKIDYRINSYDRAEEIVDNFSINQNYLRSLIARITDNGEYADGLDYRGLLREGRKIKGIAEKILRSRAFVKNK